jgi:RNA polymerase sigma factor (sigma-70 family)
MSKDLEAKSDEELMESYQLGNTEAFDLLFKRHSGRVLGFLSKRTGKMKVADDLLQEVFFKLHRSKHQYNKTLPFSPWLFSVTRSVLLDFAKKRNLEDLVEASDFDRMSAAGDDSAGVKEERDLTGALSSLPPLQQQAVSLRVYDEETFEEIATRLSTSPENARQLVSRGLKKLRDLLGRKES